MNYWYGNVVTDNIPVITTSDAEGLSHTKHGTISHPHNMSFTFFKGSNDQRASNLLRRPKHKQYNKLECASQQDKLMSAPLTMEDKCQFLNLPLINTLRGS